MLIQLKEFGLTLEGKALSWFQTLEASSFRDFSALKSDFIFAFSKMGIKHNVVVLTYNLKEEEHKTMRDCVNRLRQFIS